MIEPPTLLGRTVEILDVFTIDDHDLSLADLQGRTGLAKSTLHRILGELVDLRILERSGRHYRLGQKLFQLGMRASLHRGLIEVATPFLEDLYERTHETVHLGMLEGDEVAYVLKLGGHQQATSPSRLGGGMPLTCTAIGKALLAWAGPDLVNTLVERGLPRRTARSITSAQVLRCQLRTTLRQGVAFEYEESAVGLVCVAAPILDRADCAVAAISVAGPITRFHPERHVSALKSASAGIAATLARRDALADTSSS